MKTFKEVYYTIAENFKAHADMCCLTNSTNYKQLIAANGLIDRRCRMISINNDLSSLEFLFNYAEFNALQANMPESEDSALKKNKYLCRLCEYGYVPIIFLPTDLINEWTPVLLSRVNAIGLPMIKVPSNGFVFTGKYNTYDYWVHKTDLGKFMGIPPEKVRMVAAMKEVYKLC